jgi:hypothetical protein
MVRFETKLTHSQRALRDKLIACNALPPDPLYPHERMKVAKQIGVYGDGVGTFRPNGTTWWCEEHARFKPALQERSGGPIDKTRGQRWTYNPRKSG